MKSGISLKKENNLFLPQWGPYNKSYLGASHIADKDRGFRFDLNLFPGFYSKTVLLPKDNADGGVKMLHSSADVSHYLYRYELRWQDKIYMDAEFVSDNEKLTVVCNFVNDTEYPESLALDAVMSMRCCSQNRRDQRGISISKESGTVWVDAIDYTDINLNQKIAYDGLLLGEARGNEFTSASYLSSEHFGAEGNFAEYKFEPVLTDKFFIRYKGHGSVTLKTKRFCYELDLPQHDCVETFKADISKEMLSEFKIYPHNAKLELDGFLIGGNAEFYDDITPFIPKVSDNGENLEVCFSNYNYQVLCDTQSYSVRRLHTNDPGMLLLDRVHSNLAEMFSEGENLRQYVDVFIRPIFLDAKSSKKITITICANKSENYNACHEFYEPPHNAEGNKYMLSQKIMSAVTLTNVVWPVYYRRKFILHNTPGRNWDSLYTWDSGFIGMGLAEMSTQRAVECLNMYMTDVADRHSPYIFHGSPVPTQILLYAHLYAKNGDKEFLKEFYPRIRQQYRFFADMRKDKKIKENGLFALWDIFYNSGGWDDYPTQVYVHKHHLEETVCPVVNTAFTVLCGKILKNLAAEIGEDTVEYDEDIRFYSDAVNKYAWDEKSGYYGYVSYDNGPRILMVDGVNGNMGMDGVYPYIAGISDSKQSRAIIKNIKSGLMTELGVGTVDIRAPYYKIDGGWNGSIWMPHQWILWKALLDNGEIDLATEVAEKALKLWEKEVSLTYDCYECFSLINGRGKGFHQFSGLSTPVLMWFSALYRPYTVTTGHLSIVKNQKKESNLYSFDVKLGGSDPCILVCLEEDKDYTFTTSGKVKKINNGTYVIGNFGKRDDSVKISY